MQKNQNIEKIIFKVVQMKLLAMHITNQKRSLAMFTKYLLNILMTFGIKKKYNVDPYNVFLAIATNIAVLHKTGFVLQGHISVKTKSLNSLNVFFII